MNALFEPMKKKRRFTEVTTIEEPEESKADREGVNKVKNGPAKGVYASTFR